MALYCDPPRPTRPELTRKFNVREKKGCWKMQESVTVVAHVKGNDNNLSTLILNLSSILNPIYNGFYLHQPYPALIQLSPAVGQAAAGAAGRGVAAKQLKLEDRRVAEAVPVEIRGATGLRASTINGIYEPCIATCDGWPVYRKQSDPDIWLEYTAVTNEVRCLTVVPTVQRDD